MPVALALIMFSLLAGIVLFNTGQLASEKTRVVNAADAAAYSGAVWQARALNFQAYTNRAMIANQVSIAQLVSLASWSQYGRITARNIDETLGLIPYIKAYTEALRETMTAIDDVVQGLGSALTSVLNGLLGVLSQAQEAVFTASFVVAPAIVHAVTKENDERYNIESAYSVASLGENALAWKRLSKRYSDDKSLERKAALVTASRDEFSSSRSWTWDIIDTPVYKLWIKKEGETRLVRQDDQGTDSSTGSSLNMGSGSGGGGGAWGWKGKDTLSIHDKTRTFRGWKHNELPVGWGESYVPDDKEDCPDSDDSSGDFLAGLLGSGCGWGENRSAEALADSEAEELSSQYDGIRAYRDLADLRAQNKDPRLLLAVEVQVPESGVRTSSKVDGIGSSQPAQGKLRSGFGPGMFYAADGMAASSTAAVSTAEVYFKRPIYLQRKGRENFLQGNRNLLEYASLFSPYWEVRLVDTGWARTLGAWALRSPEILSRGVAGGADGAARYADQARMETEELARVPQAIRSQLTPYVAQVVQSPLVAQIQQATDLVGRVRSSGYSLPDFASLSSLPGLDVVDQLRDVAQDAIKSGLSGIVSDAAGSFTGLEQYIGTDTAIPDALTSLSDGQIEGIVDAVENYKEDLGQLADDTLAGVKDEVQVQQAAIQEQIDTLKESIQQQAGTERQQTQALMDELESQRQGLESQLNDRVDEVTTDLESELENWDETIEVIKNGG